MIGGVGVPLRVLPPWVQRVAGFLPGRYAVEALDACYLPGGLGLGGARFALAALVVIGIAACIAGSRMFRWDCGQKLPRGARPWIVFALGAWAAVGVVAERTGRLDAPVSMAASQPWQSITASDIQAISYSNLPNDEGTIAPLARNLDDLSAASRQRVAGISKLLDTWPPAQEPDLVQRIRNLLSAAAVFDVLEDPDEGAAAFVILEKARQQASPGDLEKILTYIIRTPSAGSVLTRAPALGIQGEITEAAARERVNMYAAKLLKRTLGK
jgi:ABC-2 type transport system permease protein